MIKRILMPIDESEVSGPILSWITGLAKSLDAEIVLLTVVNRERIALPEAIAVGERPSVHTPLRRSPVLGRETVVMSESWGVIPAIGSGVDREFSPMFRTKFTDPSTEDAIDGVKHLADRLRLAGFKTVMMAEIGDPATEIIRIANDERVDLIAMATHRESKLARGILGSVTDRVIHGSSIPVMTIRPKDGNGGELRIPDAVVVPLDGSKRAESAIPIAIEIAEQTDALMVLVRVIGEFPYTIVAETWHYYGRPLVITHMSKVANRYLEQHVQTAKKKGVAVATRTPTGNVATNVIGIAEEFEDPLVVMSTRGDSGLKRWVLGSVTDKVVRVSGHPVLIVP